MTRYLRIYVPAVLSLALALSPSLPGFSRVYQAVGATDTLANNATWIGIFFTLVALALALHQSEMESRSDLLQRTIENRVPGAHIALIRDDDFYEEFLRACRRATSTVRISYLSAVPPNSTERKEVRAYYRASARVVKNRPAVQFKRIVRHSEQNDDWVSTLVKEFTGTPNMSIAVLRDLPADHEMPLALSVQVVDSEWVWFVAVESHKRKSDFRDVAVVSRDMGRAMDIYFERLWAVSEVKLEHGVPR